MNEKGKQFNFNSMLLMVLVGLGGWNLLSTHNAILANARMSDSIDAMNLRLDTVMRTHWTAAHMQLYGDKFEKLNPTVRVPDAFEIQKSYTQ